MTTDPRLAALIDAALSDGHVAEWVHTACVRCGRALMWLPGQKRHKCAWCGRRAVWAGGAR